jgi:hypothetical protein
MQSAIESTAWFNGSASNRVKSECFEEEDQMMAYRFAKADGRGIWKRAVTYDAFTNYQRDARAPDQSPSQFWKDVTKNAYVKGEMGTPEYLREMQKKFNEIAQQDSSAKVEAGWRGPIFAVWITTTGTHDWANYFADTPATELKLRTEGTFF